MYSPTEKLQHLISDLIENQYVLEKIEMRLLELIEMGADFSISYKSQTLLHCLVQGYFFDKNVIAIDALLRTKQDLVSKLNDSGLSILQVLLNTMIRLHAMAFENFKKIALNFAKHAADVSVLDTHKDSGNPLLHHFIDKEDNMGIEALLQINKECIHYKNKDNQSPLFFLMSQIIEKESRLHIAILLMQYGAKIDNPYIVNTLFRCFGYATEVEIIKLLSLDNALATIKNAEGQTPLHFLVHNKPNLEVDCLEQLIQLGSDLFTKDNEGRSLLHSAVLAENFKLAFQLEKRGLDIKEASLSGQSQFDFFVKKEKKWFQFYSQDVIEKVQVSKKDLNNRS